MKTIEQAAKEFAENYGKENKYAFDKKSIAEIAFKLGVDFAQRWISVEDELPEQTNVVLCRKLNKETNEYEYAVASYNKTIKKWIVEYSLIDIRFEYIPEHWRPIELK